MTDDTKSKPSLSQQAAIASIAAPGIAIILNILTNPMFQDSRKDNLAIGIICSSMIVFGFICAIVGLLGVRKYGKKRILGRSIAGFLINGVIITSVIFALHRTHDIEMQRKQRHISISRPTTFSEFPAGLQQPNVVYSFIKGDPNDNIPDIVCLIERLGGKISKDDDLTGFASSHPNVTILKENWNGQKIDVFRVQEDLQGVRVLTFNAQVPLLPQAIQVKIIGLMDREDEIRQDLRTVLAGIDGPTNW